MIDFDFFKHKDAELAAKLTIHKNSKAGFSVAADELMNLSNWKYCAFAKDKKEVGDKYI